MSPLSRKGLSVSQGAPAMADSIPALLLGRGNALGNQSNRAPVLILSPRHRHQPGRHLREGPSQSPSILRPPHPYGHCKYLCVHTLPSSSPKPHTKPNPDTPRWRGVPWKPEALLLPLLLHADFPVVGSSQEAGFPCSLGGWRGGGGIITGMFWHVPRRTEHLVIYLASK